MPRLTKCYRKCVLVSSADTVSRNTFGIMYVITSWKYCNASCVFLYWKIKKRQLIKIVHLLKNAEKTFKFLASRLSNGSKEDWAVIPRAKNTGRELSDRKFLLVIGVWKKLVSDPVECFFPSEEMKCILLSLMDKIWVNICGGLGFFVCCGFFPSFLDISHWRSGLVNILQDLFGIKSPFRFNLILGVN